MALQEWCSPPQRGFSGLRHRDCLCRQASDSRSIANALLSYLLGKVCRQLAADIELPANDKVRQVVLALIILTVEQENLNVKAKSLGGYPEGDNFEVGELEHNPASGNISEFIHASSFTRFPAKSLQIPKILTKFAMKLYISWLIVVIEMLY